MWTYAAWSKDQAVLTGEERWARRADFLLPLVKGYSSEKAFELLAQSLQVLGGSGYTQDYPIEQYLRDAKIDSIYEGTTGIQAMDLFFRKIVRDQGQTVANLIGRDVRLRQGRGRRRRPAPRRRRSSAGCSTTLQAHLGVAVGHLFASRERPVPDLQGRSPPHAAPRIDGRGRHLLADCCATPRSRALVPEMTIS